MKLTTKKELVYVLTALFTSIAGLTWFQLVNNDPSVAAAWNWAEWKVVLFTSSVTVIAQTLVTWLAYMSDPNQQRPIDMPTMPEPPATTDDVK